MKTAYKYYSITDEVDDTAIYKVKLSTNGATKICGSGDWRKEFSFLISSLRETDYIVNELSEEEAFLVNI